MKFIITRTSIWDRKEKPCEEAKQAKATYLDYRTTKSLQEAKQYHWYEQWYNSTVNHRVERGMIVGEKKTKDKVWIVEINSLVDILNLIKKYGEIIILRSDYKEYPFEIEIYDDYRE